MAEKLSNGAVPRDAAEDSNSGQQEKTATASPPSPPSDSESKDESQDPKAKDGILKFTDTLFSYFRLLFYANPTWIDYTLIVVGSISAAAAGTPFPIMGILFGQLIDDMNTAACDRDSGDASADPADVQPAVNDKVLQLVYIAIATLVVQYVYFLAWNLVSQRLAHRLREKYFRSLLAHEASFFDDRRAGEVSSRLNADISLIQSGTSEKVGVFIATISFFIAAFVVGFTRFVKLTAILLCVVPAFLFMSVVCGGFVQKYSTLVNDAVGSASSIASEALSHVAVVQAFGAGPRLEAKFGGHMVEAHRQGLKKAVWAGVQTGLLYFIAFSANALAFWQGSIEIAKNVSGESDSGITVGAIYTVVFIIIDACVLLGGIAPLLPLFGGASAAFVKLRKDIEEPSSIDGTDDRGDKLPPGTPGEVEFRGLTFSYPSRPGHPVLKNVSFTCPAGKYTALVGLSGSGKSTIVGLVPRLYDPDEGSVFLDGQNLRDLNVRNLRSFIGLVQQEPSLLDRSILENIALGLVNSPMEDHQRLKPILHGSELSKLAQDVKEEGLRGDIVTAAQAYGDEVVEIAQLVLRATELADASAFITRLEHGFGTQVGTSGKLVSGGQRQRIALARALIRDPKILLLDEATASLDSASEKRIQNAVEMASKGRTLISIAHRLSTIKNADNIIVMRAGEIVEQGSHAELMVRKGAYADLVNLQNLQPADENDSAAPSRSSMVSKESLDSVEDEKSAAAATAAATVRIDPIDRTKEEASAAEQQEKDSSSGPNAGTSTPENENPSELDAERTVWQVCKSVMSMIRPNLLWLAVACAAAFVVGCTYTGSGTIFGHAVGASSPCNEASYIESRGAFLSGMFFVLAVVELFANFTSWSAFGLIAEKLLFRIRVLSFRSLFRQDVQWHQSRDRNPSTLLSVITKDSAAIGGFSGSIMGTALAVVVNLIVGIIVCHIVAWKIAIVCLVMVPMLLGAGIMQMRVLSKYEAKHADAYASAVGITVEAVNSMKTVSALSLEHEVFGRFRRALSGPRKDMLVAATWANAWLAIGNGVGGMIYAFAYWWGARQIIEGTYTQTQFLIVLIAMMVAASLWGQMFTLAPEVSKAKAAAGRIFNLLDLDEGTSAAGKTGKLPSTGAMALEKDNHKGKEKSGHGTGSGDDDRDVEAEADAVASASRPAGGVNVAFRNVSFSYPARPDHQILHEMSFTIQAGQFCGLVGPSGAGKSTIMALVQRMYRLSSGSVEVDGRDVSLLSEDDTIGTSRATPSFLDDVAVVPQDSALFDGTVRFNVGLGARPGHEATHEEIVEACKLANVHETIAALPDGYDTECGPNGSRLSGGQRQRVAIARALVRKPRLLLLDESTSALDAESEKALQEGLERAARGITVVAIAHRLHTVRKADVIFVCEGGKVVAKGRHEELMEKSESYRINAMQQMLGN